MRPCHLNQNWSSAFEGACCCPVELCSGGCMRKVSEGFLFGESHLREVFVHLLNRLAVAGFKRNCPRSPKRPPRATLQNIHLKPSCEATAIALGIIRNGPQCFRHQNRRIQVVKNSDQPFTRMGTATDYAGHGLLPWAAKEFIRGAKSFRSVVSAASGRASR